jgi:hypothetical protein
MANAVSNLDDRVKVSSDLSDEERAALGFGEEEGAAQEPRELEDVLEEAMATPSTEIPDWVVLPSGLALPPGRQVTFLRFRSSWTDVSSKGDRQCIVWNLSEADEKLALRRTRGDALRSIDELTKQAIRAVDGHKANWTGVAKIGETLGQGDVSKFWNEIGAKCRQQLKNVYIKAHTLDVGEAADFFTSCIAVRTVGT